MDKPELKIENIIKRMQEDEQRGKTYEVYE